MITRNLFGIPVQAATMPDALQAVEKSVASRESLDIGVVNAAKIVNMRKNPELLESVLSADVVYADGMSVVWASRLLRTPLPGRIAGIDLMHEILRVGNEKKFRIFCLGAKQVILDRVLEAFARDYPNVEIVGSRDGYFSENEEELVAQQIRDARPDVLFVAITSPKKENFMAHWSEMMGVPVVHGVGGSFDVVAGLVERAPESWQKLGLEWLYRVKQEPRRLWKRYLVTNTVFAGLVFREYFRGTQQS